ncbi:membrane protein insertase YidC [Motilibacter aurantiacus]|uniref:membrane protein insertase YidC n=1 Tax=Motilibacter aurantiacus TaxID=2714955 RepID=UPI0014095D8D|nr:membrane protein insertase YidC [Motilibacter aurantiacus]
MGQILAPLEYVVSKILQAWHSVLTAAGLPEASGVTWALSIVGLVIVMRILLIPLFVRQIKAQRGLQVLQPEIKKIQEKYKNDRERQSKELMELYKRTGTNPFASCLPILLQAPIFFSLFRVLNGVAHENTPPGFPPELVEPAYNAALFGARISDTFLGTSDASSRVLTIVLIVLMSVTTFLTQRQVMTKNMPPSSMDSPFAQQQKILLYVFPLVFAVSGVNFPIGVLIYWLTTNVWSLGQQLYVIQRNPTPGSPAAIALEKRRAEHAGRATGPFGWIGRLFGRGRDEAPSLRKGPDDGGSSVPGTPGSPAPAGGPAAGGASRTGQRQQPKRNQPKRQPRNKR